MLLQGIVLKICHQLRGQRSIQSTYYILTGKKSIQTIQDAHLYQSSQYFGILPLLKRDEFEQMIKRLSLEAYITNLNEKEMYRLTEAGKMWLKDHQRALAPLTFQGIKFHGMDDVFYKRLSLLIQVLSNQRMNCSTYVPVVDDEAVMRWMKQYYQTIKPKIQSYRKELYKELVQVLNRFPERHAEIFVRRFSGYERYGMSLQQLAHLYQMTPYDVYLLLKHMIHQILEILLSESTFFRLLRNLLADLSNNEFLTRSAKTTYNLLQKNYSIDQIAHQRSLKTNTIYDHLVEIALYDPTFSIDAYVSKEEQEKILQVMQKVQSFRLKEIKNHLPSEISYFKIRLTLAASTRLGDRFANT